MGVGMSDRLMAMSMAMRSYRHRIVLMRVVPIVMRVGMLMFELLVRMLVVMRFGKVDHHADEHQRTADDKPPAA